MNEQINTVAPVDGMEIPEALRRLPDSNVLTLPTEREVEEGIFVQTDEDLGTEEVTVN